MASNDEILTALRRLRDGDLTQQMEGDSEVAQTYNEVLDRLSQLTSETVRVTRELGTEGRFGGHVSVPTAEGAWKEMASEINHMAASLTDQFRDVATTVTARANGDMTRRCTVPARGEVDALKATLNVMGDQFGVFASELRRVARETGVEGRLGAQAQVRGLAGVWKDVADDVNVMSANLESRSSIN
jgi:HAMP domain-containing protein